MIIKTQYKIESDSWEFYFYDKDEAGRRTVQMFGCNELSVPVGSHIPPSFKLSNEDFKQLKELLNKHDET